MWSPRAWLVAPLVLITALPLLGCGGSDAPPKAMMSLSPAEGYAPLDLRFADASTGKVTSWHWDFGDGASSTEANPSHRFERPASYRVTLVVRGPGGQDSHTETVTVREHTASFSVNPERGVAPLVVQFTDTSPVSSAPRWDFGDGTTGEGKGVEHRYDVPGTYTAALGTDTPSGPKIVIHTITVYAPLVADFSASPMEGLAPLSVRLIDRSTGDVVSRVWEFGDGTTDTSVSPTHTYTQPGAYTVRLSISGPAGTQNTTATVRAVAAPTLTPSPVVRTCDDTSAAAKLRPSVVHIVSPTAIGRSSGTGMIASSDGVVVTANHVVEQSASATVTLTDGRSFPARVVQRRTDADLAVLRINATGLTPVVLGDERTLRQGQALLTLGWPRPEVIAGDPTLTGGRFSALRVDAGITYVQTDTPINPGNSGGPLITQCGEVVGVIDFRIPNAQGLNFAVGVSHVRTMLALAPATPAPSAAPAVTTTPRTSVASPEAVVRRFYLLLDQRQYEAAYALLSMRARSSISFEVWRDGYLNTVRVVLVDAMQKADRPTVSVRVSATESGPRGNVTREFTGTWTLIQEGGEWRLDVGKIQVIPD